MKNPIISLTIALFIVVLAGTILSACGSTSPASNSSGGSSASAALMQERCSVCHSLTRVTSAHHTADEWKATVDRMINHGAQLTPQEETTLIDYLAQNYK